VVEEKKLRREWGGDALKPHGEWGGDASFSRAFGSRFSRQSRENGGFAAKTTGANTIPPATQANFIPSMSAHCLSRALPRTCLFCVVKYIEINFEAL